MDATTAVIILHGSGKGHDSEFLQRVLHFWASPQRGADITEVIPFDFPYMVKMQETGKKRPPDRFDVLCDALAAKMEALTAARVLLIGKSLGGRVALSLRAHPKVLGAVAMGYPFHPTAKPDKWRKEPLLLTGAPFLIQHGTHDPFGRYEEVTAEPWAKTLPIEWLSGANHDFVPTKSSGNTFDSIMMQALDSQWQWYKTL